MSKFATEHFEELQRTPLNFDPRIPQSPAQSIEASNPKLYTAKDPSGKVVNVRTAKVVNVP